MHRATDENEKLNRHIHKFSSLGIDNLTFHTRSITFNLNDTIANEIGQHLHTNKFTKLVTQNKLMLQSSYFLTNINNNAE